MIASPSPISDINKPPPGKLHAELSRAVPACYGCDDLDPEHGFYRNERGQVRFTLSPRGRQEILERLLALNLGLSSKGGHV